MGERLGHHFHARLADVVGGVAGRRVMPCFDPVLTIIAGVPCATIASAKACTPLMTPHRLTSSTCRQRSYPRTVRHRHRCRHCSSAARPRRSFHRRRASAAAHPPSTRHRLRRPAHRLCRCGRARRPLPPQPRATPPARSASTMRMPRPAHLRAVARPMPEAAPVITAVRPLVRTPAVRTGLAIFLSLSDHKTGRADTSSSIGG